MRNAIFHFKKKISVPSPLKYHDMKPDLPYCKISERLHVALQLPGAHAHGVGLPVLSFERDELLAKSFTDRLRQRRVARQRLNSRAQIGGQALRHGLACGKTFVQIFVTGIGGTQALVQAVQPGGQRGGNRRVDIARRVGLAPLQPPGHGAHQAGAVVVAKGFPHR